MKEPKAKISVEMANITCDIVEKKMAGMAKCKNYIC